jgi:hypothetical protein
MDISGKVSSIGEGIDALFADNSAGYSQKDNFIYDNRRVAVKDTIQYSAADDGRYAAKDQNPQFPADIHIDTSPFLFK